MFLSRGLVLEQVLKNKMIMSSKNHWPQRRQNPDNVVETSSPSGDSGVESGLPAGNQTVEVILCEPESSKIPRNFSELTRLLFTM